MRQPSAVWFTAKKHVAILPEDLPPIKPSQIRVESVISAISHGSEMLAYRGQVDANLQLDLPTLAGGYGFPLKYGYANVGRVTEKGRGVVGPKPGALVFTLHPHQTEYIVEASRAIELPEGLAPDDAVFAANMETAVNALLDQPIRLGESVVVMGQGIVGLLIGILARRAGAGQVIAVDPFPLRRRVSLDSGTDIALEPGDGLSREIRRLTDGRGADVVFEASGAPAALQQAIDCAAREATVVACSWYGTKQVDLSLGERFHRDRVRIRSSQVGQLDPSLSARWDRKRRTGVVLGLLDEIRPGRFITHRLPFAKAAEAYRLIDRRSEETLQVALTYEGGV